MPVFRYRAVNGAGDIVEGTMDAPTQSAAVRQLNSTGLVPIRADEARSTLWSRQISLDFGRRRGPSLVQLAMFSAFSGFGLIGELRAGVVERMRVTPISRVAMLLGRALRDVAILLVQAVLIIVCALPFGLTIEPGGFIVALILLALIGLIMTTFSYSVALAVKSEDVLAPVINSVFLPVLLLSGILLPMSLAPRWLQWVAAFNPFSHAVNAMRSLFAGAVLNGTVALGILLMLAVSVVSLFFAGRAFAQSQA